MLESRATIKDTTSSRIWLKEIDSKSILFYVKFFFVRFREGEELKKH